MRHVVLAVVACLAACGDNRSSTDTTVPCATVADCPAAAACEAAACIAGTCAVAPLAAGTPTADQVAGDCHERRCDGAGTATDVVDDRDVPVDDSDCTRDTCTAGVPANAPLPRATSCAGGGKCDGAGACTGCLAATDCPGFDTECSTRTCTAGACGLVLADRGHAVLQQTAGDCRVRACDGAGNIEAAVDDADVPDDHNPCTDDACTGGVPSHDFVELHTSCGAGALECDGAGACVGCVVETECPGHDDDCEQRTCAEGVCGVVDADLGTPRTVQAPGDCKTAICDGRGGATANVDDDDLPVDGVACTSDVCSAGVATNPAAPAETVCSLAGGDPGVCDGTTTACRPCDIAEDCPATGDACIVATCTDHACGTAPLDGAALPSDGDDCTLDACASGVAYPVVDGLPCNDGSAADTRCRAHACVPAIALALVDDATTGAASAVAIEEHYASDGALVPGGTHALPVADDGAGAHACTLTGTSTGEGELARSVDEASLVLGCYDAAPGAPTAAATAPRVIARVDALGQIDTTTALPQAFAMGGAIAAAATTDGIDLWAAGTAGGGPTTGGVWHTTIGATSGEVQIESVAPIGVRTLAIQASGALLFPATYQLYGAADAASGGYQNVFAIGSGTPYAGSHAGTPLSGLPTTGASSPQGFALFDLSAAVTNADTLYVADDRAIASGGGLQKWTLGTSGGSWTLAATLSVDGATVGDRALAAFRVPAATAGCAASATCVEILVVTAASDVLAFLDPNDGVTAPTGGPLGIAAPTGEAYRGIALAPHPRRPMATFAADNSGLAGKVCFQGLSFGQGFLAACTEDQGVWRNGLATPEAWTNVDGTGAGTSVTSLRGHFVSAPLDNPAVVFLTEPDPTTNINDWRSNSPPSWPANGQTAFQNSGTPIQLWSVKTGSSTNNVLGGWHATLGAVVLHGNNNINAVTSVVGAGVTGTVTSVTSGPASLPSTDINIAVYGQSGDGAGTPASGGGIYWTCNLSGTSGGTFVEHDTGIAAADRALVYALTADSATYDATASRASCLGSGTVLGFATTYYAALRGGGSVYKTTDGGASWQLGNAGLPAHVEVRQIAIETNATFHDLLFAATSDGVYASRDAGAHWTAAGLQGKSVRSVALGPADRTGTPRVFAGVDDAVGIYSAP